jgi:hypothetical protein
MKTLMVLFTAFVATAAFAAESKVVKFAVPDHGTVEFSVPNDWTSTVLARPGIPPTMRIAGPKGEPMLMLTAFWNTDKEPNLTSAANVDKMMGDVVARVQPSAVQEKLTVTPLQGTAGTGKYFWATDKAPRAGEYEHLAQGLYSTGDLLLQFTTLTHKEPPQGVAPSLEVVKSARQKR